MANVWKVFHKFNGEVSEIIHQFDGNVWEIIHRYKLAASRKRINNFDFGICKVVDNLHFKVGKILHNLECAGEFKDLSV